MGFVNETELKEGDIRLKGLFKQFSDYAESTDFDTDGSCLEDETKISYLHPWKISIPSLRNYFGEKIAIYFSFLSLYCRSLFEMTILSIIFQIIFGEVTDNDKLKVYKTIFSILIILWSTIFLENLKRTQNKFAFEYGQEDFEEEQAIRPNFEGKFIRSINNDDMNDEYYPLIKRMAKMAISYLISSIIIFCVLLIVYLIFTFRSYLKGCDCVGGNSFLINTVPSILNSIQIFIFNAIYQNVAIFSNDKENHKYFTSYENSLIFKIFFFIFVNTFNSFFLIAFLSSWFPSLKLCTVKVGNNEIEDCSKFLEAQMQTIFIVTFIKNIPEFLTPLIKTKLKEKKSKKRDTPVISPFTAIDKAINREYDLEAYQTNMEVDGTMGDYMEMTIQFAFLNLFSLAFPMAFFLAFINNIVEIQVDKYKLTKFCRRPIPSGAANIGVWQFIFQIISFLGIFTNAGLIAFTSNIIFTRKIMFFTIFLLLFLGIKYLAMVFIPDIPNNVSMIKKRHKIIVERVVKGFNNEIKDKVKQCKPAIKIAGVISLIDKKKFDKEKEEENIINLN